MAFCAAIATAVVLGACGGGIPGNAVAQVGSAPITQAALDHWMAVANDAGQAANGTAAPPLPVPPDFTACIAGQKKQAANASSTHSALKALCQQQYTSLVQEVMQYLIESLWIEGEAHDKGVKVTDAQVEKSYEQQRKTSKPPLTTTKALDTFLAKSGQTITDLKWRTYVNLLENGLLLQLQTKTSKVSSAQIAAYYHKNLKSLVTPQTRNIHVVEVAKLATANKVKSLLASGTPYQQVATQYSTDPTSKAAGGSMPGVRVGSVTLPQQATAAVFAASKGVLSGPVKTAFGYYVFTVDTIVPASTPTLAQATARIKAAIVSTQYQAASAKITHDYKTKWPALTTCRSGFQVATLCSNAPKTSSTTSG